MPIEIADINFDKHYLTATSDDIKTIAAPLKKFGIVMFDHFRIYEDNSALDLTTVPEFCELYAKEALYLEGCAGNFDEYHDGYYFWDTLDTPNIHKALEQKCGAAHGITIVKTYKNYCDHFYIAGDINNPGIKNFFISQRELLEDFISYFYVKAAPLIAGAREHSYVFPNGKKECKNMLQPAIIDTQFECFRKLITETAPIIKKNSLSKRELECIHHCAQGKPAKLIAAELNISKKTVERHFENIRSKLGVKNKAAMLRELLSFDFI